jgi:hypothetical protein
MTTDLSHREGARLVDPVEHPVSIRTATVGRDTLTVISREKPTILLPKTVRLKYETLRFGVASTVAVRGQLPGGHEYICYLDTGYGDYLAVNDIVVREAGLPIHPMGRDSASSGYVGVAYVPRVSFGDMTVVNPPCDYLQVHWELKVLGVSLWREKWMIMGLRLLRMFPHVVFDNPRREVAFELRLTVHMSVAGRKHAVDFDTCGGDALILRPRAWKEVSAGREHRVREGRFASAQLGWLPCRRGTLGTLEVAGMTWHDARVQLLPEESPYAPGVDFQVGLGFFRDCVVVIDFENRLLWIQRPATP